MSPFYVPAAPLADRVRKIAPVMPAARFLSKQRTIGDQARCRNEIRLLRRAWRKSCLDLIEQHESRAEALGRAIDASALPHHPPPIDGRTLTGSPILPPHGRSCSFRPRTCAVSTSQL